MKPTHPARAVRSGIPRIPHTRSLACLCKRTSVAPTDERRVKHSSVFHVKHFRPTPDVSRAAVPHGFLRLFYGSCTLRHTPVMSSTFLPFSNVKHFRAGTQLASLTGNGSPVLERGWPRPSPHPEQSGLECCRRTPADARGSAAELCPSAFPWPPAHDIPLLMDLLPRRLPDALPTCHAHPPPAILSWIVGGLHAQSCMVAYCTLRVHFMCMHTSFTMGAHMKYT
jgi:hypothetical protein